MDQHQRHGVHVLIYGPPGAGKLTIARELEARYGMRVLDNHVSVDAALRLFPFGTPAFNDLVEELRCTMLGAAAAARLFVASTLVYAFGIDDEHLGRLLAASRNHGAKTFVVQLAPSDAALADRISAPSRIGTNKVSDADFLQQMMARNDLRTPAPGTDLTIDNSKVSPADAADRIAVLVGLTDAST